MESKRESLNILKDFVVEKVAKEAHCSGFYPRRKLIWNTFISDPVAIATIIEQAQLLLKIDPTLPPTLPSQRINAGPITGRQSMRSVKDHRLG